MKHVPVRSCIVCRRQRDKAELLRIVRKPDGEIVFDVMGREPGRGAYICADGDCMATALKKRALNRAYKTQIDVSVYDKLQNEYEALRKKNEQNQ